VSSIKGHCSIEPKFALLTELLQATRIVREAKDLEELRKVWDQVVALWFEYLDN
jgi:hypothetical protein